MSNRIKGITVEIGGDTTKLHTALKQVSTENKHTQSELRDINRLLINLIPATLNLSHKSVCRLETTIIA